MVVSRNSISLTYPRSIVVQSRVSRSIYPTSCVRREDNGRLARIVAVMLRTERRALDYPCFVIAQSRRDRFLINLRTAARNIVNRRFDIEFDAISDTIAMILWARQRRRSLFAGMSASCTTGFDLG